MKVDRPGKMSARRLGSCGEDLAAAFLEANGYRILERGYRTRFGEIDIIAVDGETIAFIEVKLRRSAACGYPVEAIDRKKQLQIARIARHYISSRKCDHAICRFDSVSISHRHGDEHDVELIKDAFRAD